MSSIRSALSLSVAILTLVPQAVVAAASFTISPASFNFKPQGAGSYAEQYAVLTNTGSTTLAGGGSGGWTTSDGQIYFDAAFDGSGGGPAIAPGESRRIVVRFHPPVSATPGTKSTGIKFTKFEANATGGWMLPGTTVVLAASGVVAAPLYRLSTRTLSSWYQVVVSHVSEPQTVTLTNTSAAVLPIYSITLSNRLDYDTSFLRWSHDCPAMLAPGAFCTLTARYAPAPGTYTEQIAAFDIELPSPGGGRERAFVEFRGIPLQPSFQASSKVVDFGNQVVGSLSEPRTVTVTNSFELPLKFTASTWSDTGVILQGLGASQFRQTTTCVAGLVLVPGETCSVSFRYQPTAKGPSPYAQVLVRGSFEFAGNPGATVTSTTVLNLKGNGVIGYTVSPSSLNFGSVPSGSTSDKQLVTLTNPSPETVGLSSVQLGGTHAGQFRMSNGCGSRLLPGASCSISLQFLPTSPGTKSAGVRIASTAFPAEATVSLSGKANSYSLREITAPADSSCAPEAVTGVRMLRINGSGTAIGVATCFTATGDLARPYAFRGERGFVWSSSAGARPLPSWSRAAVALRPSDINATGIIVGHEVLEATAGSTANILPLRWDAAGAVTRAYPETSCGGDSAARSINDRGDIVGQAQAVAAGNCSGPRLLLTTSAGSQVIGPIAGEIIRMNQGRVVLYGDLYRGQSAYYAWTPGAGTRLLAVDNAEGSPDRLRYDLFDLNAGGTAAGGRWTGSCKDAYGNDTAELVRAMTMTSTGQQVPLPNLVTGGQSLAYALNTQGDAVGIATGVATPPCGTYSDIRAVLWKGGQVLDLNKALPKGSGIRLTEAVGINDAGQVIAHGTVDGELRKPCPEIKVQDGKVVGYIPRLCKPVHAYLLSPATP